MNKNTTILLGAVAVLAIGVGAYVSMSSPSDEGFSTQSVRGGKKTEAIKTSSDTTKKVKNPTTSPINGGLNGSNDEVNGKPIVKYGSNGKCMVEFDEGSPAIGQASENGGGTCCKIEHDNGNKVCYNGKEPGVSGVSYGDQLVKDELTAQDNTR